MTSIETRVAAIVEPGMLIAVADGPSSPFATVAGAISAAAADSGGVDLLLGWCLQLPDDFMPGAFGQVRSIMGGFALRDLVAEGSVEYVPCRLGAVPALVAGALRPQLLIVTVRPGAEGWELGSDVGWTMAAARAGARLLGVVNHSLPAASRERPFAWDAVTILGETDVAPVDVVTPPVDEVSARIGRRVASLITPGSVVQFGPGAVATAALRELDVAVSLDSGMLSDDVVELDRRGLLADEPRAAYLAGTSLLYRWANGRQVVHGVEVSHNIERLAARDLVAINAALEIDHTGQINVETAAGIQVGGVGGHPDFAAAASRAVKGISIIALPSARRGVSTLVERLSAPASTPRSDVDVVVTEHGVADLRGKGDARRRLTLQAIWP